MSANDLVLGNIVGSNFFNTLAVVGVSGLIHPFSCATGYVLIRDLWVMVALSASLAVFGCAFGKGRRGGVVGRGKGIVWAAVFVGYLILLFVQEHI